MVLTGCGEQAAADRAQPASSGPAETSPSPAPAAETPAVKAGQGAAQLTTMVGMSGTCLRLVVAEETAPGCRGVMMNLVYRDGRSSFMFFDETEGRLVSFSGISGNDVLYGDAITQPLDSITVTRNVKSPTAERLRAIGACRYTNPFIGTATVTCMAETESGRWTGEFRSNGEPPTLTELD